MLLLESVVNPISDRSSWQLNPIFPIILFTIRNSAKRKEGPTPSCSRIVALSFSTLCLRISQFYFSMGAGQGKGYNSAVECHLDVVEVISSSLIIPKPNVSFSILTCSPAAIEWELIMDKSLVGLTWGGREGYISGSELQANMKRMDTSYALEWKRIPNQLCLRTRKL